MELGWTGLLGRTMKVSMTVSIRMVVVADEGMSGATGKDYRAGFYDGFYDGRRSR